jgi:hypothetical protein
LFIFKGSNDETELVRSRNIGRKQGAQDPRTTCYLVGKSKNKLEGPQRPQRSIKKAGFHTGVVPLTEGLILFRA